MKHRIFSFFIISICFRLFFPLSIVAQSDTLLTDLEKMWLQENAHKIVFAPNPSWPPYDYMEAGIHKGIVADFMELIEQRLGVHFKRAYYTTWDELYIALKSGEVDFNGSIQQTFDRSNFLVFTNVYTSVPMIALVRDNFTGEFVADPTAYRCMSVKSYAYNESILKEYGLRELQFCDDDLQGLLSLSFGTTDVFFTDIAVATYYINRYSINNLRILFELPYSWELRFGFTKKNEGLRNVFQKILDEIPQEKKLEIYKKHFIREQNIESISFLDKYNEYFRLILFPALAVILTVVLVIFRLRRIVNIKTKALKEELEKNKEASGIIKSNERRLDALLQLSQLLPQSANDYWEKALGFAISLSESKAGFIYSVNPRMSALELICSKIEIGYNIDFARVVFVESDLILQTYIAERKAEMGQFSKNTFTELKLLDSIRLDSDLFWLTVPVQHGNEDVMIIGLCGRESSYQNNEIQQSKLLMESAFNLVVNYQLQNQIVQAKRKAEESESFKSVFMANVGHDIKTPLNSIMGFADILMHDSLPDSTTYKYASIIYKSSGQLQEMVQDLLTLSSIQSGKEDVQFSNFEIRELLEEMKDLFAFQSKLKKVDLTISIDNNVPVNLYSDEGKIRQILHNLMGNAFKFTEAGNVQIIVSNVINELVFTVSDTGSGIPIEKQERIFDRFSQADESIVKNYGGTGLGLAIVKSYVELLGGRLWLESEPGFGSTFGFTVPLKKPL